MNGLPIAPVDRLIRKSGADRVSEEAAFAMAEALSEYGFEVSVQAKKLANHAGRKTIKAEDIELAVKSI